eukprot:scaffold39234_cov33-Tisochrysis_lutea.AAC.3
MLSASDCALIFVLRMLYHLSLRPVMALRMSMRCDPQAHGERGALQAKALALALGAVAFHRKWYGLD